VVQGRGNLRDEPEREDRRNMSAYKPKIYRSQDGCCICKAKSSSSRFTDSGKYEEDCIGCFKLDQQRSGEICNACVLIVKRWKKLPRNTVKNWAHVVDARTGPGTKNIFKQKKKEVSTPTSPPFEKFKYKHVYKRKPLKIKQIADHEDDIGHLSDASQRSESPLATPFASLTPAFLDNSYWRRQLVCCGVVYVGRLGEVVLDQRLYRPCSARGHSMKAVEKPEQETLATPSEPCSPSSSAFSTSLNPSLIESLVEAELQAFQSMDTEETEDEEFYADATKMNKNEELNTTTDCEGDEGFCDRLDQKSEQFRSSLSLIATH